jgi:hypothetical protein
MNLLIDFLSVLGGLAALVAVGVAGLFIIPNAAVVLVLVAPMTAALAALAMRRLPGPLSLWLLAIGLVMIPPLRLGLPYVLALAAVRVMARTEPPFASVFWVAVLGFLIGAGVTLAYVLLKPLEGIDLAAYFLPFFVGILGIAAGLVFMAAWRSRLRQLLRVRLR